MLVTDELAQATFGSWMDVSSGSAAMQNTNILFASSLIQFTN